MTSLLPLAKKVLLVSSWAPPAIGGPQNLYHILSRLQSDRYCIFTSEKNFNPAVKHLGSKLPCQYYFYDRVSAPLAAGAWRRFARPLLLARQAGRYVRAIPLGLRVIAREKPDLLLGISDERFSLPLTLILSRFSGVPYACYLFDLFKGNNLPMRWRIVAAALEPPLLRRAATIIVTNQGTANYYRQRYGAALRVAAVHNSIDPAPYSAIRTAYQPRPPYTVLFTGHLYWVQERSLRNIIEAVLGIKDLDVRCQCFVPNLPQPLQRTYAGNPRVIFTSAPQSAMPDTQTAADVLVLPLSWGTRAPAIIATASPGKLTDYLIAGRPILIHAPPYAYVTRYARERGFAHVVDEESIPQLQEGIRKLLTDLPYARQLVANALKTFSVNHDADVNARRFAKIINGLQPDRTPDIKKPAV